MVDMDTAAASSRRRPISQVSLPIGAFGQCGDDDGLRGGRGGTEAAMRRVHDDIDLSLLVFEFWYR